MFRARTSDESFLSYGCIIFVRLVRSIRRSFGTFCERSEKCSETFGIENGAKEKNNVDTQKSSLREIEFYE